MTQFLDINGARELVKGIYKKLQESGSSYRISTRSSDTGWTSDSCNVIYVYNSGTHPTYYDTLYIQKKS